VILSLSIIGYSKEVIIEHYEEIEYVVVIS
jgi:hypothetical protein